MPVVVVARLHARAGREADAEAALRELAEHTHGEAGCLSYALHRAADDAQTFVIVERWTSAVALESHNQQAYVQAAFARAAELFDEPPDIRPLEPVATGDPMKGTL